MLILIILLYNIIAFNKAEDITMPIDITGIVIENEPQLIPEEIVVEQPSVEITTWEIITEEIATWEIITEEIATWEIITWEIITWEIITWVELISGDQEYFSWVLAELSWEILYDLSGEIVGEIHVESWDIIPVDFSGESLLPQPLSVIYPTQQIQLNVSWYIMLDSLNSVITTWWEEGANYCSRIAYENLTSILKAWIRTWKETNDYLLQGDAEQLVIQGLEEKMLLEVTSGEIKTIFSDENGTWYGYVYDVYSSFINFETRTYHRITVIYADDEQRYVLDPLRGARTTAPQKVADYIAYYDDEIDVHRYIGQAYIPSVIREKYMLDEEITQLLFPQAPLLVVSESTWDAATWEVQEPETLTTGEIMSDIFTWTTEVLEIPDVVLPEETLVQNTSNDVSVWWGVEQHPVVEEIIEWYFNKAYEKGEYSEKIIQLQKMLTWLQIYDGALDGVYSDTIIESVYQYQLAKNILTQDDAVGVRWYLGPKTRIALNQSYIEYQQYENTLKQQATEQITSTWTILSNEYIPTETWMNEVIIPISGQETLNNIWVLSWINIVLLFDPFANPLLFSWMMQNTWFQYALSGFVYTTWTQIGLTFNTGTKEEILKYLNDQWYETGSLTLVSVNSETLVGDMILDFAQFSWALLVPILLQSTNELSGQIAEVSLPKWAILKTADGEEFIWELAPPEFLDSDMVQEQVEQEVISAIDVWSDEHIQFEDSSGNYMYATFRVPVPGMNIWDTVDVSYSEDWENRIYMISVNVQNIDGDPYAIFESNHFTSFYLGTDTGTFVIANDADYTTWLSVTLNNNASGATHMRFGNSIAERDAASRVTYNTNYSRTLTWIDGDGIRWVYAQFSGNDIVRNVSDSIILDTSTGTQASGLVTWLDGSYTSTTIYDRSPNGYNFTASNAGILWISRSWDQIMSFNGSRYGYRATTPTISTYPFTVSARVKPDRVTGVQWVVMRSRSTSTTIYYGIQLNAAKPSLVARNSTAFTTDGTTTLTVGKRYHIVWVFASNTSRTLYVNGVQEATTGTRVTLNTTSPRWSVGSYGGSTINNYLSGNVDEVRIYNRALSASEISWLYMQIPNFDPLITSTGTPTLYGEYTPKIRLTGTTLTISGRTIQVTDAWSWRWKTVPFATWLSVGTYNVTLNYMNVYGKTWSITYTSWLIITPFSSTWIRVIYSTTGWTNGDVTATLTWLDPTYMIVNNFGSETHVFTGNGSFVYQFVDKVGTTWTITATVTWIDKTVPIFTWVSSGAYYSWDKSVTFSDENLSWATLNGVGYLSWTIIVWEGNYVFVVADLAGNYTWATFIIDKTTPTFAWVISGMTYTGILSWWIYMGNKSITFSDVNLSWATLNGVPYIAWTVITWAWEYTFEVVDHAGNRTWATFSIYLETDQQINNQLISSWYIVGSTSLIPLDGNYYIWTSDIDMAPFTGQLLQPVVLQSTNTFWGDLLEVEISAGAVLENAGDTPFVWILQAPEFQTPSNYDAALWQTVISAVDVGSTNHVYFKDTGGNDMEVVFRMPVPGRNEGELIDVYTSEDGNIFDYHISTNVKLIWGEPYVIFTSTHFSVVVTTANNGTNLSADKSANSTSGSAYTALSNIVVTEWVNTDFGVSQSNVTLILTAPNNRRFRAWSGSVSYTANRDITAASISVTSTTATITYSTNGTPNRIDALTISNLWIQAISGNILPSSGNILRTCANPGTATVVGITCDVTNFWSLSQTYGAHKHMIITLPGQEFVAGSGNSGTALNQITTVWFVIPKITAADQFYNIVVSYTWAKTLSYTWPGGVPTYTTAVTFSGGQSTTTLNTTLTEVKTWVTLKVSDWVFSWPVSSVFDVRDWSAILTYNTTWRFENQITNNGSVSGNIMVTLSTGAFTWAIANYILFTNLPAGLTGAVTLSGTKQLLVSLSGLATAHAAANSVSNIILTFTTWAFVDMLPNEVQYSTKTWLSLSFYDPNPSTGITWRADTTLDADNEESHGCWAWVCQEYNYGALSYGWLSDFGSKMLIKFSMASIPTGATITSATIKLTKLNLWGIPTDNGTGFKLRKIINNSWWIEGTKSATAASAGEPNYKQRKWTQEDWYNGYPGLVQGLDYESSELLAIWWFTGAAQAQYTQTMPLSTAWVATLQDWLDNPESNQWFALVDPNQNWIYIATKERSTESQRPVLSVTYVTDIAAPMITTVTPTDNSSGVVLDTDLNIIFNEYVTAVSGKNIIIKKSVDDSVVETINAANTWLVVLSNGNKTVTIDPTNILQSNTGYYIQIESGAFIDRASNVFTGITNTTTWNFTTLDADSVPTITSPSISWLEYTNVRLWWTVTSTWSSSIKELWVVRSTSAGFDIASANKLSQTGDRNNPWTFSLHIAWFASWSTIYFRSFAANNQGTGYSSETGFILKPDTVRFWTATMISNDTFMTNRSAVTWIAYYELYVSTWSSCTSYISGYGPVIVTGTSKRIMGLEKETTYYYKAIAVNSWGISPVSAIHTVATSFLPRPWVWLKFEESVGTVAYDSSENFNHGMIYGTPLMQQTGAENKAYYFDAVDDFVAVTDFDMEPDLTVSFWFKKSTTGNNEHIFSRGNDGDANSINVIFDDATQSLRTYINGSQTILNITGALYTGLLDNQRHFYSLTIADDESVPGKKLCTVFLDGITKLTDNSINAGSFNPTPNINVGRRSITSAGTYYKWYVDDVRIYGKILTPPEINNLYLMFKDVTKPTATVEYNPWFWLASDGPVVVTLTWASEAIVITNNWWLSGYTFTGNGVFTFTFRDEWFNTWEVTASVYWINPVFTPITWANTNSIYTSNIITLTGYDVGVITWVSVTTWILYKNGIAVGQSATGSNNDQFYIELTSSSGYMETVSSTMTIGITSWTYSITTRDTYFSIRAPSELSFDEWEVSETPFVVEKTFSGINEYFKLTDNVGADVWYYTTIQISDLDNGSWDVIPYTTIAIKSLNGVETLSWSANSNVYSAITWTYQYFTASPLTFIRRDTGANGGLIWTYGIYTVWKIDIPALQNIWNYTWVITYTLYE